MKDNRLTQPAEGQVPELEQKVAKVLHPFQRFIHDQTTSSKTLFLFTVLALVIANTGFKETIADFFDTYIGIAINSHMYQMTLLHWINDGLMALFFLILGMEIKREVLVGELSSPANLTPVLGAAVAGMLFPALTFWLLNVGTEFEAGWGIPMATDTAFAVGVLALLGKRVPIAAFSFLTGLAIIDDIGAIMVIALFYTDTLNFFSLGIAAALTGMMLLLNLLGIRRPIVYFGFGVLLWLAVLNSGIHATIAGILIALTIPARPKVKPAIIMEKLSRLSLRFQNIVQNRAAGKPVLASKTQHELADELKKTANQATTPLRRWERYLHIPVGLMVLPIFAFANSGVVFNPESLLTTLESPLAWGIFLGLTVGKGLGIPLMTWVVVKTGMGELPRGLTMAHMFGLGMLGAIGFTMSIFITGLGFEGNDQAQTIAKSAILFTSLIAGIAGYLIFRFAPAKQTVDRKGATIKGASINEQ